MSAKQAKWQSKTNNYPTGHACERAELVRPYTDLTAKACLGDHYATCSARLMMTHMLLVIYWFLIIGCNEWPLPVIVSRVAGVTISQQRLVREIITPPAPRGS
jgi:hypothetical protein